MPDHEDVGAESAATIVETALSVSENNISNMNSNEQDDVPLAKLLKKGFISNVATTNSVMSTRSHESSLLKICLFLHLVFTMRKMLNLVHHDMHHLLGHQFRLRLLLLIRLQNLYLILLMNLLRMWKGLMFLLLGLLLMVKILTMLTLYNQYC